MSPSADEAQVECHGAQNVRRLARALGASPAYASGLAAVYWNRVYPYESKEYRTRECRNDGLYDMRPETNVFP